MSGAPRNGNGHAHKHEAGPPEQLANWPDIREVPALSSVASQIIQITSKDPFNWEECIRLFETDAGLSAKLLRLVNSSYYGLRRSISSVDRAARMLGERTFRCLALGLAVAGSLPRPKLEPFNPDLFWRDNLTRALFAKGIAHLSKSGVADETFSAALLQNMAVPLLLHVKGEQYSKLLERYKSEGRPLYVLESDHFGWNHAQLGGWIAEKWRFPSSMALAIRKHHDDSFSTAPVDSEDRLVRWVQLAALLPSSSGTESDRWTSALRVLKEHLPNIPFLPLAEKVDGAVGELAKLFLESDLPAKSLTERFTLAEKELEV